MDPRTPFHSHPIRRTLDPGSNGFGANQWCHGRQFDWLMSRMSEADRTHFVSGRRTLGRLRERPRPIGRGLFTPFRMDRTSISSVRPKADEVKRTYRHLSCKLFTQQTTCKAPFNWASNDCHGNPCLNTCCLLNSFTDSTSHGFLRL